jgi:hypothetical protein
VKNQYLAFVLDNKSRDKLIKAFPPSFSKVICHHVTLMFNNIHPDTVEEFIDVKDITIIGIAADEAIEALIVEIDGSHKRKDGSTYHITHSLTPGKRKPVDSNTLIKNKGFTKVSPIVVSGEVRLEDK